MMSEEVWRSKSDEDLVAASHRLDEYTDVGQLVIVAELQRRRASGLIADTLAEDAKSIAENPDRTADRAVDAPQGVVISLWRGAVPLWQTYWVCGVLTNLVWLVFIAIAVATQVQLLVLLVVALNLIYSVFIMVAIWRSAGRYTGNRIWGDLARISIALALIRTAAGLFLRP